MGFKERFQKRADDALDYLASDEARSDLKSTARAARDKAKEVAQSEQAKKVATEGRKVVDEVLDRLSKGDTPTQAVAKATKSKLARENKPETSPDEAPRS